MKLRPLQYLVADQHDDDVIVCVVSQLLQPALDILKGDLLRNIVHQKSSDCTTGISIDKAFFQAGKRQEGTHKQISAFRPPKEREEGRESENGQIGG